jgi:hypothetical protein
MRHPVRVPGVIGLCLLALLGSLALTAGVAQAKGHFYVEIGKEKILLTKIIEAKGEEDVMLKLLVEALNLEVLCGEFKTDEGLMKPEGSTLAALLFDQCDALSISPLQQLPCTVEVETARVKDLLILHNGKTYDLFVAENTGEPLTTIHFKGAECVLPETMKLTGSAVAQECAPSTMETYLTKHLIEQAPAALFPADVMKLGVNTARLDGSVWVSAINGLHEGRPFAALGL